MKVLFHAAFAAEGVGLAEVHYQWQFNGVDIADATNSTYTLSSVSPTNDGSYRVIVSTGAGSVASSNATLTAITPPVITGISLPTNRVCIYGNILSFNVTATANGQTNGFPLSYQWKWNGTNIAGATETAYSFPADDDSSGLYSVTVANAAGSTNAYWQVTVTNAINVTNDLLLIYNTNSENSRVVKDYYLAHRPMVGGANVLGIGCTNTESFLPSEYTNVFVPQIEAWLTNNPTKLPQYVILFLDIPSRVNTNRPPPNGWVIDPGAMSSVSYSLHTNFNGWRPFVMHLDMGTTNDCRAYIDKLEYFGTNYSPGELVISASSSSLYGNTNYVLDGIRHGGAYTNGVFDPSFPNFSSRSYVVSSATNGLLSAGVPTNSILFFDGLDIYTNNTPPPLIHPTSKSNIAGYMTWGVHSALEANYPTDSKVAWVGTNRWWIIETVESFNGQRESGAGMFIKWFSAGAFGGTNYSNTPVGAVSHVDEPFLDRINDPAEYFSLWASGKNFAIAAWSSRKTEYFQAIGDPLVKR